MADSHTPKPAAKHAAKKKDDGDVILLFCEICSRLKLDGEDFCPRCGHRG